MPQVYEAPRLTRLGYVTALTASDMKCSVGNDHDGHGVPWFARHDYRSPTEEWDEVGPGGNLTGNTVGPFTYAEWITSGRCASGDLGLHPVTGK